MQSDKLIQSLIEQTTQIIEQVEKLKTNDLPFLTWKENENSWCILECLEHLNLYGDFYLPEIQHKIKNTQTKNEVAFESGFLGAYFAKIMLPKEVPNKMKTAKNKNPLHVKFSSKLDKTVIERFISQQMLLLDLLNQSKSVSLNKIKIKTSISSLIKLKLGDTFQFLINHNLRHLNQIDRIKIVSKNL